MAIDFSFSLEVFRDFTHEIHPMRIAQMLMQPYSESGSVRRAMGDLPR